MWFWRTLVGGYGCGFVILGVCAATPSYLMGFLRHRGGVVIRWCGGRSHRAAYGLRRYEHWLAMLADMASRGEVGWVVCDSRGHWSDP